VQCGSHFKRWRECPILSRQIDEAILKLKREGKKLLKE
jgi:hypothetical protein